MLGFPVHDLLFPRHDLVPDVRLKVGINDIDHDSVDDREAEGVREARKTEALLPAGDSTRALEIEYPRDIFLPVPPDLSVLPEKVRDPSHTLLLHFFTISSEVLWNKIGEYAGMGKTMFPRLIRGGSAVN